jgi:hypothetical protein
MEPQPSGYGYAFWDEFVPLAANRYRLRLVP